MHGETVKLQRLLVKLNWICVSNRWQFNREVFIRFSPWIAN